MPDLPPVRFKRKQGLPETEEEFRHRFMREPATDAEMEKYRGPDPNVGDVPEEEKEWSMSPKQLRAKQFDERLDTIGKALRGR